MLPAFLAALSITLASGAARSERDTSCEPRDATDPAYAAYCGAFDASETACRMNSSSCYWLETSTHREELCEAIDVDNAAYRAYCRGFGETACRMNGSLCYWTWR